ncbi:MAG: APC family permease [Desulfovibrio sp.]
MENNTSKSIGSLQLAGLLVGAVLGSGVILLPPIAHAQLGSWALVAWLAILGLGAVFAALFAKLALAYPGSEGVPIAVREAFGKRAGSLASNYMISAVCVGPIAVMIIASETMVRAFHLSQEMIPLLSAFLLVASGLLLLRKLAFVGTVALCANICIGIVLVSGSVLTILHAPTSPAPVADFDGLAMGKTLLLLFWAIIGWEIIGNYSMEVRQPKKTILRATVLGVGAISSIYILVAWALEAVAAQTGRNDLVVADVVTSVLGPYAHFVVMVITTTLCVCTFLMFVGGVARLIASLAAQGRFIPFLQRRNVNGAPVAAMGLLLSLHAVSLFFVYLEVITLEQVVAYANVFFLSNSLIAVLAAMKLFTSPFLRIPCVFLCMGFVALLSFSSFWSLGALGVVTVYTLGGDSLRGFLPRFVRSS